jgi:hypothetical protein
MLSDQVCRLLTAYVDGELSAPQQQAVLQLLQGSAEARELLHKLQQDAEQLRQLPRHGLGPNFASQVLRAADERLGQPLRRPVRRVPMEISPWLGLAGAAAVLLVVGAASYFYFAAAVPKPDAGGAIANDDTARGDALLANAASRPATDDRPKAELLPAPRPEQIVQGSESSPAPTQPAQEVAVQENPLDSILAIPNPKMELFPEIADPKLALILSLAQLDQSQPQKELAEELQKDKAYRLEMTCQEGGKAIDRLKAAFQAHGIRLVIDQLAQDRLKLKLRTNYALYVENITREELTKILRRLGAEDSKAKPRRQFDKVVLQRMTGEDYHEVAKLLGVEVKVLQASRSDLDLSKPLSKTTAEQVEKVLKEGRPASIKPGERLAVVVPYNPVRPRSPSPQIRQFLDGRGVRQADSLQLVLVLRGNNG